ncbi:MAG: transposase [Gammaproteobacteria bacterium]|nr:transposase [Gammaproteobacteria bacterium]
MKQQEFQLPEIPESEQTPLVQELLLVILEQQKRIRELGEEIEKLKGHKGKPRLRASQMDKQERKAKEERKPGPKKSKTGELEIHEEQVIAPRELPENPRAQGWRFKGYNDFVVQELRLDTRNIRYRLEEWQGPNGEYLKGKLPESVSGHYGAWLKSYVLYEHHHQRVTQPLLLQQLREWGIRISSGQLNNLLIEGKAVFHEEKAQLLETGLQVSNHIHVDDTGARHKGKNGYCTHIGNELFAWFESTQSKSRENFLGLLRVGSKDYVVNVGALEYMALNKLPKGKLELLEEGKSFPDEQTWKNYLEGLGITGSRHIRIATEGALMGCILARGLSEDMGIMSDDAGQFNIFRHALCWIHAERNINKLVPLNDTHAKHIHWVRSQIWDLYAALKAYKMDKSLQTPTFQEEIRARFDEMCRTRTDYATLNGHLKRLATNKTELLRVLDDPSLPLHNNLSERDIREYVYRRKISGSTRSDEGRRCRDTFASLKKTCRKLDIPFWDYLYDRVSNTNAFAPLPETIRARASPTAVVCS